MPNLWRRFFYPIISSRGEDYYLDDCVYGLEATSDGYFAHVRGTEDYEVTLSLSDPTSLDTVQSMDCTCPHAREGNYCKHMAALCFAVDDLLSSGNNDCCGVSDFPVRVVADVGIASDGSIPTDEDLSAFIAKLSKQRLQTLLTELAFSNDLVRKRLEALLSMETVQSESTTAPVVFDERKILRVIKKLIHQYTESEMYFDDDEMDSYEMESNAIRLFSYIEDQIKLMQRYALHEMAFNIVLFTVSELDRTRYDFSEMAEMVIKQCPNLLGALFERTPPEQWPARFDLLLDYLANNPDSLSEDMLFDFCLKTFVDDKSLKALCSLVDARLQTLQESPKSENDFGQRDYSIEAAVKRRMILMGKLGQDIAAQEAFGRNYWYLQPVRRFLCDRCIESKDDDKAISLLLECLDLDKNGSRYIDSYQRSLLDVYERAGKTEDLRNLLILRLSADWPYFEDFLRLKTTFQPDEWEKVKDDLLPRMKMSKDMLCQILKEEEQYDALLEQVRGFSSFWQLDRYEDVLKPLFPQELLELSASIVRKEAQEVGKRSHYHELVRRLRRMRKYPGGIEVVRTIVAEWKAQYKNRRAMQDELSRL